MLHCISEDYISLWFVLNFRYLENVEMKFIKNTSMYFPCNFLFCLREMKSFDSSELLTSCLSFTGMRDLRTVSFDPTPETLFSVLCSNLEQFPVM